jgi:hypothetical protein
MGGVNTKKLFDLSGRVAITTGGSVGLGQLRATNRSGRSAAADATSKDFRGSHFEGCASGS